MNYSFADYLPRIVAETGAPPRKGWAKTAWSIILALITLVVLGQLFIEEAEPVDKETQIVLPFFEKQARYLVGTGTLFQQEKNQLFQQALALNQGPVDLRLRFLALAGELANPSKALELLQEFDRLVADHQQTLTPDQARCRRLLGQLFRDYQRGQLTGPSLTDDDRAFVRLTLGWFGDLALAPPGITLPKVKIGAGAGVQVSVALQPVPAPHPQARQAVLALAQETFVTLISMFGVAFFLTVIGFLGFLLLFVKFAFSGWVQIRFKCGTEHAGIYAETFAVWLVLFSVLEVLAAGLAEDDNHLLLSGLAMLLSLLALAWPVWRGIPWRQVRQDIGLNLGRSPLAESAIGVACYIMSLPLVAAGLIVMVILMFSLRVLEGSAEDPFAFPNYPRHPLMDAMTNRDWWTLIQAFFLASVVAPVVEEIMFRGVLYSQVREASQRFGWFLSTLFSAIVVSFLFAVLHPQGLFAVPVLMALACGFALAREWRSTLLPAMVGHGLNNALVTLAALFFLAN